MIGFAIGAVFGGAFGFFTACLCITAGQADAERIEMRCTKTGRKF